MTDEKPHIKKEDSVKIMVEKSSNFISNNWQWIVQTFVPVIVLLAVMKTQVATLQRDTLDLKNKIDGISVVVNNFNAQSVEIKNLQNSVEREISDRRMLEAQIISLNNKVSRLEALIETRRNNGR